MKMPLLRNKNSCYEQLLDEVDFTGDVEWHGDDNCLKDGVIDEVAEKLQQMCKQIADNESNGIFTFKSTKAKNEFDNKAAILLHSKLELDYSQVNQKDFWSYLSLIKTPNVVESRFGKTENRFICGVKKWKHIYERLWWRADIIYNANKVDEPYYLLNGTEEDYWVSLLESEISSCRNLSKKLTEALFHDDRNFDMNSRRAIIKRIRKMRTSYSIEAVCDDRMKQFIDYIIESSAVKTN